MIKRWISFLHDKKSPVRFWIFLTLCVLCLVGFADVYEDVFLDPAEGDFGSADFDISIMKFINAFRSPHITQMMTDLTALGSISVVVTLFVIMASVLITYRDFKGLTYISIVLAGGGLWPLLLKPIFNRVRPDIVDHLVPVTNLSFPSGHSFGAASVYLALAFYSAGYARSLAQEMFFYALGALLIFIVGLTRIYLGVHFPTDVLAGVSGGLAWGFFVSALYELYIRAPQNSQKVLFAPRPKIRTNHSV